MSIRWTVRDHFGNEIYLTHERWEHIAKPINHPEMEEFEGHLKKTIQSCKKLGDVGSFVSLRRSEVTPVK